MVFRHPDGTTAGPAKWPVHVLRLEPSGDDGPPTTAGRTNNDDEYGLDAGRTCTRTPGELTAQEQRNLITHRRFGHKGTAVLRQMVKDGLLTTTEFNERAAMPFCEGCAVGAIRKRDDRIRHHSTYTPEPIPGEVAVADHVPFAETKLGGITGLFVCVDKATRPRVMRRHKRLDGCGA